MASYRVCRTSRCLEAPCANDVPEATNDFRKETTLVEFNRLSIVVGKPEDFVHIGVVFRC